MWTPTQSHVILIGFMGAGKSTLGRATAKALGWPFIDLDHWIEAQEERSISTIFAEEGEPYFRALEREAISAMAHLSVPHVIATGGGTPCQGHNMTQLNQMGTTIYLDLSVNTLVGRLQGMRAHRPKLKALSDEALPEYVETLLTERRPFYQQAHLHLTEQDQTPAKLMARLPQQGGETLF